MHRFTLQAVMLFTLLTLPSAVLADRSYSIQNNPDLQNGWTLSGTITTDGTIGSIQSSNIMAWTWTITKGVNSFTASSTDPGADAEVMNSGITATAAGLLLLPGGPIVPSNSLGLIEIPNGLLFFSPQQPVSSSVIVWQRNGLGSILLVAGIAGQPIAGWQDPAIGSGSSSWLIASPAAVPEPASLYIVGFGAVCVYVMGHKRRARRTATTGA